MDKRDKRVSTKALAIALIFAILFAVIFAIFPLTNAKARDDRGPLGGVIHYVIDDLDNCLTEDEELELKYELRDACLAADCKIIIVITSDLEGKTSKQFADDYADKTFGVGSDTVVLLLFNSYNKPEYADATDYISTSGKMVDKLDKYIDSMFDSIYKKMGEPQGDKYAYNEETGTYGGYDYYAACDAFAESVVVYAGRFELPDCVDPDFSSGSGGIVTSPDAKSFTGWLIELFWSILRMLGGRSFGYY